MIPKYRRRILEALEHYQCPACGSRKAIFEEVELSVTTWTYNAKKGEWEYSGCESVEEHGYSPEDMMEIPAYQVCCGICERPICWPDGTVVNVLGRLGFDDWLNSLADEWEAQQKAKGKLAAEVEAAKENINPVGHLAELEARLKALDNITGLKTLGAKVEAIKSEIQADIQAELEFLKKEECNQ